MIDAAAGELLTFAGEWKARHGLTSAEYSWMLVNLLSIHLRMRVRDERDRPDREEENA